MPGWGGAGSGRGERGVGCCPEEWGAWPWGAGVELAREERRAGRRRRGAGRGERGRPPRGGLRRAGPLSRQVRGELRRPRWAGTRGGPGPAAAPGPPPETAPPSPALATGLVGRAGAWPALRGRR